MGNVADKSMLDLLAKEAGEILHLLVKPVKPVKRGGEQHAQSETVSRKETVEEKQVSETIIVRRTVIEEIQIKKS
jgi:hypothetical protein